MLRLPLGPLGPGLGLLSIDQDRSLISALPARRSAPTYQTKQVSKKGGKAEEEKREEGRRSCDSSAAIPERSPTPLHYPLAALADGARRCVEYDATVGPTVERVVVAVKDKQRLEAGEEMRVAYGWTEFRVQSLFELTKQQTD